MNVTDYIGLAVIFILAVVAASQAVILRGFVLSSRFDPDFEPHVTTGREREEIRRRVTQLGPQGVSVEDTLNLLFTVRMIEVGKYKDEDIYVPDDPYEDV